ncbi:type III secretion system chaperone family protein [Actinomyces howellii]|uniref:Bacterial sensory transduction regulator n=1 Tax=Actinomyces howellii TaxID=52771 RepID=A0A448HHA1_9ACTO|nr:YbjN domain-containing protein [Actinomyces howellii]VEG28404.1 Uncharacterised protein [Actinomyces howellii]
MAWWNKPAAGQTPKVTVDRIAAWFDKNDLNYDRHESGEAIISGFGEYGYVVAIPETTMLQVHARFYTNLAVDDASRAQLRELLGEFNTSQVMPTLSTFVDEDGAQVSADVVASITEGLNDEQLDDLLDTAAHVVLRTFEEIGEALGIEPASDEDDE